MTRITRMVMKGFKSFGNKAELVFGSGYNCVLGPNGAGKCLDYDVLVQLSDGRKVKIGELVEEKLKSNKFYKIDDGYVILGDNTEILSMNPDNLKVESKKIEKFVKRTSPEYLLKIKTRSGREVTATEYHPLFVLENNKIKSIKAEELKEGIKVAVPRNIPIEPQTNIFVELLDLIEAEDELYVPYNERYKAIFISCKENKTLKAIAKKINIPYNAIKGLLDEQAINFNYLVKILRYANQNDIQIINLIQYFKAKNQNIVYNIPWQNSPELARFFGYISAEGRLPPKSSQIWFVNGNDEIVTDYINLAQTLFGIKPLVKEYKENCYDIIFYSVPLRTFLTKIGIGIDGTINKKINNLFLQHSSNKELSEFLNGLFSGDGYISDRSAEIVTKSFDLANGIETILLRLGILFTTKVKVKIATNSGFSGVYKQITISNQSNLKIFADNIKLIHKAKRKRLENTITKKENPNLDLIDANMIIQNVVKDLKLNVKRLKAEFPRLDSYLYNQCTPSRNGIQFLISNIFEQSSKTQIVVSDNLSALKLLAYSDIYWDEIIEIEKIKSTHEYVYDLTIEKHHNFIANNFIVHNSNIMDALCFVLGKGSAKELRVEKASNLIYNGGKTKEPAKAAEVSIYFDNADKKFPLETQEIKITRIVKDSGLSVYKINDERMTRQQVLDLLAAANIDPDGYNIILQGDIVRLVVMSTIERRQVIEEIAGISIYEEKKNKALNELQKVGEKISEAEIILKERETYLKELKKERDQAIKYKDLSDKVAQNKATLTHMKMQKKLEEKANFDEEVAKYDKTIAELQKQIDEMRKQITEKKEQITKINKEVEQKGEKEQVAMLRESEKLKVSIETNKARIGFCENEILRITTRKNQLQATVTELDAKINELAKEKDAKEKSKASTTRLIDEIDKKIEEFRKKNKLEGAGDIDKEIEAVDKLLEDKQKEVQAIREEQQNLLREKDKVEFQMNSFEEKISKVLAVEKENKQELEKLKQRQVEFKKATLELNTLLNDDTTITVQLANARNKLLSLQEEAAKLQAKSAGVTETIAMDVAVKNVLENKSRFGEVYGTVSSLGEVEAKYSLALEIAAGPRMKSIVVDSDKTATNCIKYLKENKLGTATFLPLNKIKPASQLPEAKTLASSNGVHGFALDLIQYEPKFKNVFSYVLGNTLIVDTIDVARRLGIGTIKMVTVDGDYTDISGAMHGGFRQKTREMKFQEKEVSSAIKQAEKELQNTETVSKSLEKKKLELDEKITRLRELKASLEGEIIKQEKALHLDSDDITATKKQKAELQQTLTDIDTKIRKLQDVIGASTRVLADAKIKKQNLRAQVMQLRNPTLLAELNTFEQKKAQLKEELINYGAGMRNIIMQLNNILQPEKENVTKILKQHDKEEEQFKKETNDLKESIVNQSKELQEKEKQQKEFYGKFKELFVQRDKLSEESQKIETKVIAHEQQLRSNEQKKNLFSIENARVKAERAALEEEFSKYQGVELFTNKSEEAIKKDIADFEKMFQNIGSVNMKALEVYDTIEKEYLGLLEKRDKLKAEKEEVLVMMNEIETKKKDLFLKAYEAINVKFQEMFQSISTKGIAFLHLENEKDPLSEGVAIKVRITGKKFLDIRSLSGGEKTLTALAFIFAIQEYEPASFYVFDEVDAALDKHNSEKLSLLVKKYSDKAQYIIISHNEGMISEADTLYGVSMDENNMSKVVSLKV